MVSATLGAKDSKQAKCPVDQQLCHTFSHWFSSDRPKLHRSSAFEINTRLYLFKCSWERL